MSQLFHAPRQSASTDERFTPKWVFDALGLEFDLDPASPLHHETHVPAARKLTIEDDGLTAEWAGRVWLNPPYSGTTAWARRFIAHQDGVWLAPCSDSRWYQEMLSTADLVAISADFSFVAPTGTKKSAGFPLTFAAFGKESVDGLMRLAVSGVHRMVPLVRAHSDPVLEG